jgi:hypothetical protein
VKTWMYRGAASAALVALASCGGGGGGGESPSPAPAAGTTLSAVPAEYLGTFASPCESTEGLVTLSNGGPLFVRTHTMLKYPAANIAGLLVRLDFHADASCSTGAVGYLTYDSAATQVVFRGQVLVGGKMAQKVSVSMPMPPVGAPDGKGRMVFGFLVPLYGSPSLFAPVSFDDLWYVEGDKLYEGGETKGADGFPTSLDLATVHQRIAGLPQGESQCPTRVVNWGDACSATVNAAGSRTSSVLTDLVAPGTGSATFTCKDGAWTASQASCS